MKNISFLIVLITFGLTSQELPPIQNFSPKEYDGENQNWAITQGYNGHVYVANNQNILEYNGIGWDKYKSPNASTFRAIQAKDSLVFTGQYMEFGYWKKNAVGKLNYTSISSNLQEPMIEDEEFWNILVIEDWVLFQSLDRIYSYNIHTEQFKILKAGSNKAHIFNVEDTIYFQNKDLGIYKIENGGPTLVLNDEALVDRNVVGIYGENDEMTIILDNAKFLKLSKNGLETINTALETATEGLNIYCTAQLNDGSFVLGTVSNGIYQINKRGEIVQIINQQKGLNNNTVLSIFQDKDENLWLGLDNGISLINLKSPFNEYIDKTGRLGLVYAALEFENRLYLGTNQGLFVKRSNSHEFTMVNGTEGQVWSLKVIDNTFFCGHNKGTFKITDEKAQLISSFPGTWDIKRIPGNTNILLQGNFNGLSTLKKEKGEWVFGNLIEGFTISSRFFEFIDSNKLLVNHEYKGLFGLVLDKAYTNVTKMENHSILGHGSSLTKFQDKIIYTSLDGAFLKKKDTLAFQPDDTIIKLLFEESGGVTSILMPDQESNRLWCFTHKGLSYIYRKKINASLGVNTIPIPSFFKRSLGVSGFENLMKMGEEHYLIGISNGFVTLDLKKRKKNISYSVEVNGVTSQEGFEEEIKMPLNGGITLKPKQNTISFNWGVPHFNKYDEVVYQYKLDGAFGAWSNWESRTYAVFNNLKYGDYTFSVRAKVGNKLTQNKATYSFTIERPWYLSIVALVCYSIGLIALFFGVHRLYRSYYMQRQQRLIALEKKKLKRKKLKTEKELAQIKNEKLLSEIEGKNRELAVATMSIIKKNKFLNSIKEQLVEIENSPTVKNVIKTINKNISNEDDWKFFEEAFNNADKNFLKKIKQLHPELTSNDLRLCAYLRLNLSSKEIAPLLNISVRSLEVKRYRLRKKMNLEHESGLVEHILDL